MIDSHCHLADSAFASDLDAVIERAREAGVSSALCILAAGDAAESRAARRVRALWPATMFALGVHPHHAGYFSGRAEEAAEAVRRGLTQEGARVIGEIGLDYHYDFSLPDAQQSVFAAQVMLARKLEVPVVIHTREADADTLRILRIAGQGQVRGVFHCFTGDADLAQAVLDLGFFISLSGIVTFPRATELRDVARMVPADRILVETDSPYLAPVPHRGKRNEPAYVAQVVAEVASARGVSVEEMGAQVTRNFEAFLGPNVSVQTA
jgi:TatD DNase family protein